MHRQWSVWFTSLLLFSLVCYSQRNCPYFKWFFGISALKTFANKPTVGGGGEMLNDALSGFELSGITGRLTGATTVFGLKVIHHLTDGKATLGKLDIGLLSQMTKQPKCPSSLFLVTYLFVLTTTSFNKLFHICLDKFVHVAWNIFAGWWVKKCSGSLSLTSWVLQCPQGGLYSYSWCLCESSGHLLLLTAVCRLWCVPRVCTTLLC